MKNVFLLSFVAVFIVICVEFFDSIVSAIYILSEIMWSIAKNFDLMCIILMLVFIVAFGVFLIHFFKCRDKNEIVTTVEFECPKDLNPCEVGFLVDGIVDNEDLTALFVYWASKDYISIEGKGKKQTFKKLVKEIPNDMKEYEKNIFQKIFGNETEVALSKVPEKLTGNDVISKALRSIEKDIGEKYFDKKTILLRQIYICLFALLFFFTAMYFRLEYFVDVAYVVEVVVAGSTLIYVLLSWCMLLSYDNRRKAKSRKQQIISWVMFLVFLAVCAGLLCWFYWTDPYQICCLLAEIVMMFFVTFLSQKFKIYNKAGEEKLGKIIGLKNFIEVAEKERLEMLVEEDPKVFYQILPYAYVLGVSDKWIKDFDVFKNLYQNMASDVVVISNLLMNPFLRTIVIHQGAIRSVSKLGSVISLGSNGGSGKDKGGSNFGGIRRR